MIDLKEQKVTHVLDVPKGPTEVLLRPGGHVAYVSCGGDGKVAEVDLDRWAVTRILDSGPGADDWPGPLPSQQ